MAYHDGGHELARVAQSINTPKAPAEVRLVLESPEGGLPTHARMAWESLGGDPPIRVEVQFDGKTLEVADPTRFRLPAADAGQVHFLTADLGFADASWAHAEASFGGLFGDEVLTELSALPVRWTKNQRRADLSQCFRSAGAPLRLATLEQGPAEVLVVREALAEEWLTVKVPQAAIERNQGRLDVADYLADPDPHRFDLTLGKDDDIRFVWPQASATAHPTYGLLTRMNTSQPLNASDGGLLWLLTRAVPSRPAGAPLLADAVAVAGLLAASSERRRAVVLVLGDAEPADASQTSAADVVAYLEKLRVPLHVWTTTGAIATSWGAARPIHRLSQLEKAVGALAEDLATQRIAWLESGAAADPQLDPTRCAGVGLLR